VKTIKRELEMLDSVVSVAGDVATQLVTIEYIDGGNPQEVRKTLEEIGYPASE
jgi:copper chaperone CopZ